MPQKRRVLSIPLEKTTTWDEVSKLAAYNKVPANARFMMRVSPGEGANDQPTSSIQFRWVAPAD